MKQYLVRAIVCWGRGGQTNFSSRATFCMGSNKTSLDGSQSGQANFPGPNIVSFRGQTNLSTPGGGGSESKFFWLISDLVAEGDPTFRNDPGGEHLIFGSILVGGLWTFARTGNLNPTESGSLPR